MAFEISGSSMLGFLDDWFGTPQQTNIPKYDSNKVRSSITNRILSSRQNITDEKIRNIRNSTRIRCEKTNNGRSNTTHFSSSCKALKKPCLFNIVDDPCELKNLYDVAGLAKVRVGIEDKIRRFRKTITPYVPTKAEKLSNPSLYNNTWISWGDVITT